MIFIEILYFDGEHFAREVSFRLLFLMKFEFDFTCVLSGANHVRVCSLFYMQRLLQFICRNAAGSAVHLEKCCGFCSGISFDAD